LPGLTPFMTGEINNGRVPVPPCTCYGIGVIG
jgi:hypothetical protein